MTVISGPHDYSDEDEPSLAAPMTTAGEGRVSDELMTTVKMSHHRRPYDHSDDDSCGQRPDLCDHHSGKRR